MEKINVRRVNGDYYEIELPNRKVRLLTNDAALIDDCLDLKSNRRPQNYDDPIDVIIGLYRANEGVAAPQLVQTVGVFEDATLHRWLKKNVSPVFEDVDQDFDLYRVSDIEDWIHEGAKVPLEFWEFIAGLKVQNITYLQCRTNTDKG